MRNVTDRLLTFFSGGRVFSAWMAVLAFALAGCNSSRESFCREVPSSVGEVQSFQLALVTLVPETVAKRKGRRIASVGPEAETRMAQVEASREAWLVWTERALKRAQWARDALEHDKLGKKALPLLADASLSLVSLHGFIEQRKWKKALSELDRVEKALNSAATFACAPISVNSAGKPATR